MNTGWSKNFVLFWLTLHTSRSAIDPDLCHYWNCGWLAQEATVWPSNPLKWVTCEPPTLKTWPVHRFLGSGDVLHIFFHSTTDSFPLFSNPCIQNAPWPHNQCKIVHKYFDLVEAQLLCCTHASNLVQGEPKCDLYLGQRLQKKSVKISKIPVRCAMFVNCNLIFRWELGDFILTNNHFTWVHLWLIKV